MGTSCQDKQCEQNDERSCPCNHKYPPRSKLRSTFNEVFLTIPLDFRIKTEAELFLTMVPIIPELRHPTGHMNAMGITHPNLTGHKQKA